MIFLSYRRSDSQAFTRMLEQRLIVEFGSDAVFRDLRSIELGTDFRRELERALDRCEVLVAVIGQNWLRARDPATVDYVYLELQVALERGIPVIPVLVDGATLPRPEHLPVELAPLVARQGITISSDQRFLDQSDALLRHLAQIVPRPKVGPMSASRGWRLTRRSAILLARLWFAGALGFVLGAFAAPDGASAADRGHVGLVGALAGIAVLGTTILVRRNRDRR